MLGKKICFVLSVLGGAVVSVSVSAQSVIAIGDSLSVGPFGESFFSCLKDSGQFKNLRSEASCGSRPLHWAAAEPSYVTPCGYSSRRWSTPAKNVVTNTAKQKVKKLSALSEGYEMDENLWTVFQLGTNNFSDLKANIHSPAKYVNSLKNVRAEVVKLLAQRPQGRCLWILPPPAASREQKPNGSKYTYVIPEQAQTDLRALLAEEVTKAGCAFHDSSADIVSFNDLNDDGFHFYSKEGLARAKRWAASACQTLLKLAVPNAPVRRDGNSPTPVEQPGDSSGTHQRD